MDSGVAVGAATPSSRARVCAVPGAHGRLITRAAGHRGQPPGADISRAACLRGLADGVPELSDLQAVQGSEPAEIGGNGLMPCRCGGDRRPR